MRQQFVIGVISLIVFLYVVEVTFFSSPKIARQKVIKHDRFWYRKRLYAHMASINNKKMMERFTDLHLSSEQAILDAMEEELKELESFGIDVDDFEERPIPGALKRVKLPATHISMVGDDAEVHRQRDAHDKEESLNPEPITEATKRDNDLVTDESEGNFTRELSRRFRVRDPDPDDLQKLTKKGIDFEQETDPLPESTYCEKEIFLTVLVISKPENFQRRRNIRDTWAHSYEDDFQKLKGKHPFPNGKTYSTSDVVRVIFVIGQPNVEDENLSSSLKEESRLSKDIVFGNMMENYRNLTMKTKLGLKWAFYECKTSYVLKTDDDVFVNPVVLVEWLKKAPRKNLYTGWCNSNSPVDRKPNSKWYISHEVYQSTTFPPYCLGGGYLISSDVLASVIKLSYGRLLFPMEDLYVGLMIRELDGVQPRDERKHFNLVYNGKTENSCDLNSIFLLHRVVGAENLAKLGKQARYALVNC
uniref:Hexosyltransferase n=1 Tax=Clytia hemisphaerica TaxID=252671 RepID=A0A7M5TZN8_9CNID